MNKVDVLFIDDYSSDNTLASLKEYSSRIKNFKLIKNAENKGLVNCCNLVLSMIDSPFFMRLDIDDYLANDAILRIQNEIKDLKEAFLLFNRFDVFDKEVKEFKVTSDIYTWIAAGTVFKTQSVKSVGGYRDEYWEEYDLYLRLLEGGFSYKISPQSIYYYRRGRNNMTSCQEKNLDGIKSLIERWSLPVLNKYGDFEKVLAYYGARN